MIYLKYTAVSNPRISAPLIKKILPEIKMIAILRNPIDRAVSAYQMVKGSGLETRSFHEVVLESRAHFSIVQNQGVKEYVRNGLYGQQIDFFLKYFRRDQFLFIKYDELRSDIDHTMKMICNFIGVDYIKFDTEKKYNIAAEHVKSTVEVDGDDRIILKNIFEPDIYKTENITGLDLKNWK